MRLVLNIDSKLTTVVDVNVTLWLRHQATQVSSTTLGFALPAGCFHDRSLEGVDRSLLASLEFLSGVRVLLDGFLTPKDSISSPSDFISKPFSLTN